LQLSVGLVSGTQASQFAAGMADIDSAWSVPKAVVGSGVLRAVYGLRRRRLRPKLPSSDFQQHEYYNL